jgi:hypothetical protein
MHKTIDLSLFDTRPYPHASHVIDPEKAGDRWERDATAKFLFGKKNEDLTAAAFDGFPSDYSTFHHLMTNETFVFFLSGIMAFALANRDIDQAALLGDSLVNSFLRMAEGELQHRRRALLDNYSAEQLRVISIFLTEIAGRDPYPIPDRDPAVNALHLFWGKFHPDAHPSE